MEATKVYTAQYLKELIENQLRNRITPKCPEGCNPKQFSKVLQQIRAAENGR